MLLGPFFLTSSPLKPYPCESVTFPRSLNSMRTRQAISLSFISFLVAGVWLGGDTGGSAFAAPQATPSPPVSRPRVAATPSPTRTPSAAIGDCFAKPDSRTSNSSASPRDTVTSTRSCPPISTCQLGAPSHHRRCRRRSGATSDFIRRTASWVAPRRVPGGRCW